MIMVLKRKLKKIVNSISIFLIVGCSYYSMAGSIPANINNVYIPLIENDTAEFEISENLTSKITQEIAIQNILKIICAIYLLYLGYKIIGSFSKIKEDGSKPLKFYEAANKLLA